jgi:hypothetical protein
MVTLEAGRDRHCCQDNRVAEKQEQACVFLEEISSTPKCQNKFMHLSELKSRRGASAP